MARLAALGRVHSDGGRRRPVASAGNSIPVSAPNPKSRSIAYCSSGVSRAANLAMAMLLETRIASAMVRSEEHTSELQSRLHLVCRLLLEKKKKINILMLSIESFTNNFALLYLLGVLR